MISSLLGGALIYTEVTLALKHRKKRPDGSIMGGPMQYLRTITPVLSNIYAAGGVLLLVVWSSIQSNTLSDLLTPYHIPGYATGLILAMLVLVALIGGIKRIGAISEKLVPFMFFLYTGASLWIIFMNASKLLPTFELIFRSAFSSQALLGGVAGGSLFNALRWGLFRGIQANEAGVGTATIPHSMAAVKNPQQQGILSMVAIYSHGFICLLSGLITILTGTWQDPNISFGIGMITHAFAMYFSALGPLILTISAVLFAYGTILGNSYNGSHCFTYFTKNKHLKAYYFIIAAFIFLGAIADVKSLWIISDFFLIPVAISNVIGIVYLSFRDKSLVEDTKKS
jgi:AGCS family alanine or glycine:cation symporter